MTFSSFDPKDPDDIDNFTWGFSRELETGETINTYSFPDFPSGLTLVSASNTDSTVTALISGGAAVDVSYDVTCRIVTNAARQLDFTLTIPIAEQ